MGLSDAAGAYRVTDLPGGAYRLELQDTRQPPLFHTATYYYQGAAIYPEEGADLVVDVPEDGARKLIFTDNIQLAPYVEVNAAPLVRHDQMLVFATEVITTFVSGSSVLSNDRDEEPNRLTATLVSYPTQGGITLAANGFFTYTPNSDSFMYQASDGQHNSMAVSVTILLGTGRSFLPLIAN